MRTFFRFTIRQLALLSAVVAGCVAVNRGNDPVQLVGYALGALLFVLFSPPALLIAVRLYQTRDRGR